MSLFGEVPMAAPKCSRAGCVAAAAHQLIWRNPTIHVDGRTKTWLACPEHLEFLVDYLSSRGFFLEAKAME
jgi:hypothetical protein